MTSPRREKKINDSIYQCKESDEDILQGGNFLKTELVTPLSLDDEQ